MLYYRNKKTGAVVKTTCKVSGANWEQIQAKDLRSPKTTTETSSKKEE